MRKRRQAESLRRNNGPVRDKLLSKISRLRELLRERPDYNQEQVVFSVGDGRFQPSGNP